MLDDAWAILADAIKLIESAGRQPAGEMQQVRKNTGHITGMNAVSVPKLTWSLAEHY